MSALEEKTAELSVVKRIEEEKHRRLEMEHSALTAKKEFIETNYDYTSNVTDMNLEVFKNIVASNTDVNETVHNLVQKVGGVKKEVSQILASRYTF